MRANGSMFKANEFKSLGVLMDWERPYETMSKEYEAATVRLLVYLLNMDL